MKKSNAGSDNQTNSVGKSSSEDFLVGQKRRDMDHWLADRLTHALQEVADASAIPTLDVENFRAELNGYSFDHAHDLESTLEWTITQLQKGLVQMTHPGYFGLFNPAPTYAAECADRIAAAFNPQICVWSHAPAAVEIERYVINKVAERLGFLDNRGGHFTSGGSEANHTAVTCALTVANADFAEQGSRAFVGQPRLYVSAESHLAWLKIAHQSGIGRTAVCLVPTDGQGRMDETALENIIEQDIDKGMLPVFVAATAGTTNAGMVDPLRSCADIAKRFNLWYHVDAAWGGALIADTELAKCLSGIERADSVTIDAHKWFATTMGAGMYITQRPEVLVQTYRVTASYMPSNDADWDYYVTSMQWSRRFIGLRLFLSLAVNGWEGQAARMRQGIVLIENLTAKMITMDWQVVNNSPMAVVCLVPPDGFDVNALVDKIVSQGQSWVSLAKYEGQNVMRVCITNGRTLQTNIDQLVSQLSELTN